MVAKLIEPVLSGWMLAEQIRSAKPRPGEVYVWRLGQAGVIVKFPSVTVGIDLYLSNHCEAVLPDPFDHRRLTRAPLDPAEIDFLDIVICTHDHLDHLDPPTMRSLGRRPIAPVVIAPFSSGKELELLGWEPGRIRLFRGNDAFTIGSLCITAFPVAHEALDEDEGAFPHLGFILSDGGATVAHLGDAMETDGLVKLLGGFQIDLAFMPINGRSPDRSQLGFAGNFSATEAVALARSASVRRIVPVHYDMFEQNVDVDAVVSFVAAAERSSVSHDVLEVGEQLVVSRQGVS